MRLPDLWELARRFSGLAAITVLGLAMLTLAFRSDVQPSPARDTTTIAAPPIATPAADSHVPNVQLAASPGYRPPEPEMVFYLYENEDQRRLIAAAESVAGQEAANETVTPIQRQFIALEAGTPELEEAARDAIFETMLTNDARTRVIIHDLRGR